MTKGTTSFGKKHNKTHTLCRRCGRSSYHIQKHECGSCGYPSKRKRTYQVSGWAVTIGFVRLEKMLSGDESTDASLIGLCVGQPWIFSHSRIWLFLKNSKNSCFRFRKACENENYKEGDGDSEVYSLKSCIRRRTRYRSHFGFTLFVANY